MWVDSKPTPYEGEPWGFDNGAFRDWKNGNVFDESAFMKRFERAYSVGVPYMAIVPDIVGEGKRSLEFSQQWRDRLPDWRWYLSVQDGMEILDVASAVASGRYSGIFLGGTNGFKHTASKWSALAKRVGCSFHYGRAGTPKKVEHARSVGADSCDSAFPIWTKERWAWFKYCFHKGHPQMSIQF